MSYSVRLTEVCLAAFFLLDMLLEFGVLGLSGRMIGWARRMPSAGGARMLLAMRLLPVATALLIVGAVGVPSYLRYEQDASESVGLVCTILALCGLLTLAASAIRLVWGLAISARAGKTEAGFALVGLLRPRVIISRSIREALSSTQLEAAMLHETAHSNSLDNLKRLALFAAPRLLPLGRLEAEWARLAEWAADDAAIAGEPRRAIALAEALVCVARLSGTAKGAILVSSLVSEKDDLELRVDRLLAPTDVAVRSGSRAYQLVMLGFGVAALLVSQQPRVLYLAHCAMERLVR